MPEPLPMLRRLDASRRLQAFVASRLAGLKGDRLLGAAELVGSMGWNLHGGAFAFPEVELALRDGAGLMAPSKGSEAPRVEGRTLHVLTEAYGVGGHTRLVRRWIELMDEDRHAIALTRQREKLDAAWLVPEGRDVPLIDLSPLGRPERVARLADLFRAARRVILHIHPDDACAVAAAYGAPGAECHVLNHADHVAWLGAGLPAALLNLRPGGSRLAQERRGIGAGSHGIVPLPMTAPAAVDRAAARGSLGLGDGDVLLLTVATGYKFNAVEGRSLEASLDLVLRRPELKLMAIGPDAGHPLFAALAERHPGKVKALGPIPAPDLHRAAADLYLDSYPFCSPTSLFESAALGTPVVALHTDGGELGILQCEAPGLDAQDYAASTPEAFEALVDRLLGDAALRETVGGKLRQGMGVHFAERWRGSLAAHLARRFEPQAWTGDVPVKEGLLDRTIAGLGKDPRAWAKLSRFKTLGLRGRAAFLLERFRAYA